MTDEVHDAWESVAPAWEKHRGFLAATTQNVTDAMVERLAPMSGEQMLELACGPGETGFEIARRIAPGTLIQSDFAESMVEAARRGASELGLTNIEHRIIDAQDIDLPDASVDGIACRFGFMLMPDPQAAFAGCVRVLRPGGRLVFGVWGPADRNLWILAMGLPLVQAEKIPMMDPNAPGGMFSLAQEDRIAALTDGAGLVDLEVAEVTTLVEVDDFDAWWDRQAEVAGPLAAAIETLTPEERAEMKQASRDILEPKRDGDVYRLDACALVARAVKPR